MCIRDRVEAIKEYIYHHLDSDIRREDIAVQVFMNPNYVSRLFKKVEGISLKEFIVREKMKMARALLISSQLPVSIVALKVGSVSYTHLNTPSDGTVRGERKPGILCQKPDDSSICGGSSDRRESFP